MLPNAISFLKKKTLKPIALKDLPEECDDDTRPFDKDDAKSNEINVKERGSRLNFSFSIPFPSLPSLSTSIPFITYSDSPKKSTNDSDEINGNITQSLNRNNRRWIRVRSKGWRVLAPRMSMNHLELSQTTASYPESLQIHGRPPDARLRALRDSFSLPSIPSFHRFDDPFECLSGQDIVLLGGYRGSILRDAQTGKRLWIPLVRAGLNLRKVDLAIPLCHGADDRTEDAVIADGMLTRIGPVDFCNKLVTKLQLLEKRGKCRVHIFGFDWRISPRLASKRFQHFLEQLPSNQPTSSGRSPGALVLAHSMGGLIAHHVLQMRPELFYGTVYCGTPFIHCVNILGPFKRGDALLANREILSSAVVFSMRSSFVFLPESGECFIDHRTQEKYIIDFFNHETWLEYGLSPCVSDVGERHLHHSTNASLEDPLDRTKSKSKKAIPHPHEVPKPHTQLPLPAAARRPKLKHDRKEAIEYLKRTLEETRKFKQELKVQPCKSSLVLPPLAVVYAANTPTIRGAFVEGREKIKQGNWWNFSYGPGDGVVLAKSAQLPPGFAAVARVKSCKGHIQLMNDLEAMGTAIEQVVNAKRLREEMKANA